MGEKYNQKTDVWALGCIIYEMVTKRKAFGEMNEATLREKILGYQIPRLPNHTSSPQGINDLQMIYQLCMLKTPYQRPTISELLGLQCVQDMATKYGVQIGKRRQVYTPDISLIMPVQTMSPTIIKKKHILYIVPEQPPSSSPTNE
jgi:serine/threonine protein kinase